MAAREIAINSVRKIASSADEVVGALETTMKALEKKLVRQFADLTLTQQVDTALARAQIEEILVREGLYERIGGLLNEEYQKALETSYEQYLRLYPKKAFQFSGDSLSRLQAVQALDLETFGGVASDLANELTKAVIQYQYGSASRDGLLEAITSKVETADRHLKTQFQTALFGYYQEANNRIAEDAGLDLFVYVGPDDDLTRPFCQDVLADERQEKGWTQEEIMALDNGTGLPVFQYGAGWNCRHVWVAVG